jgi:hypothetical protein
MSTDSAQSRFVTSFFTRSPCSISAAALIERLSNCNLTLCRRGQDGSLGATCEFRARSWTVPKGDFGGRCRIRGLPAESMQIVGSVTLRPAQDDCHSLLGRPEDRISPSVRTAERLVENGTALVEGGPQGPSVLAHLLLLGMRFDRTSLDRALDEGGRNGEPVMSALSIVHERVPVGMKMTPSPRTAITRLLPMESGCASRLEPARTSCWLKASGRVFTEVPRRERFFPSAGDAGLPE